MQELLGLYRFAVRSGNNPLASALGRLLARHPGLREQADRELQALPRGPGHPSAASERVLLAALLRISRSPG